MGFTYTSSSTSNAAGTVDAITGRRIWTNPLNWTSSNGGTSYPQIGDSFTINHDMVVLASETVTAGTDPDVTPAMGTYGSFMGANGSLWVAAGGTFNLRDCVQVTRKTANARNERFIIKGAFYYDGKPGVQLTIDHAANYGGLTIVLRGASWASPAVFDVSARGGTGALNMHTSTYISGGYIDSEFGRVGHDGTADQLLITHYPGTQTTGTGTYTPEVDGPLLKFQDTIVGDCVNFTVLGVTSTANLVSDRSYVKSRSGTTGLGNGVQHAFNTSAAAGTARAATRNLRFLRDSTFKHSLRLTAWYGTEVKENCVFETGLEVSNNAGGGYTIDETTFIRHRAGMQHIFHTVSGVEFAGVAVWAHNTSSFGIDQHVVSVYVTNALGNDTTEYWNKRKIWDNILVNRSGLNGALTAGSSTGGTRTVILRNLVVPKSPNGGGMEALHNYVNHDKCRLGLERSTLYCFGDTTSASGIQGTGDRLVSFQNNICVDGRDGSVGASQRALCINSQATGTASYLDTTKVGHNLKYGLRDTTAGNGYLAPGVSAGVLGTGDVVGDPLFVDSGRTVFGWIADKKGVARESGTTDAEKEAYRLDLLQYYIDQVNKRFGDPTYDASWNTLALLNDVFAAHRPLHASAATMGVDSVGDGKTYVGAVEVSQTTVTKTLAASVSTKVRRAQGLLASVATRKGGLLGLVATVHAHKLLRRTLAASALVRKRFARTLVATVAVATPLPGATSARRLAASILTRFPTRRGSPTLELEPLTTGILQYQLTRSGVAVTDAVAVASVYAPNGELITSGVELANLGDGYYHLVVRPEWTRILAGAPVLGLYWAVVTITRGGIQRTLRTLYRITYTTEV